MKTPYFTARRRRRETIAHRLLHRTPKTEGPKSRKAIRRGDAINELIVPVIRFICSGNGSETFTNVLGTATLISRYQTRYKLDNSIVPRNTWRRP